VQYGGKAPSLFRLHWRAGVVEALGGHAIGNPLETPMVAVSASMLVGLNPGAVNVVHAYVRRDDLLLKNAAGGIDVVPRATTPGPSGAPALPNDLVAKAPWAKDGIKQQF
jgi:hypothetical protein